MFWIEMALPFEAKNGPLRSPAADHAKLHDYFDLFGNSRIKSDRSEISVVACKHSKPIT